MASKKWKTRDVRDLAQGFTKLKNKEEVLKFLRDLLTVDEIEEFSRRFKVAKLLDKGLTYRKISEKTGMSTTTISRINYWRERGEGGYRLVLKRLFSKN